MIENIKKIVVCIIVVGLCFQTDLVNAAEDVPSGYAQVEVDLAQHEGIVPEELQQRYQAGITRSEYVLIALEVLALNDEEVVIAKRYPFTDIGGHMYESSIIKAYNAGLINGYADGTFKPDKLISRQEIATLVVNLVKALDETRVISQPVEYIYNDQAQIGDWATKNVDYCYANNIMKGVGTGADGRSIIAPTATATIEQAILLMYRLADAEDLYTQLKLSNVVIKDVHDGEVISVISGGFTAFANSNGDEIAEYLYKLQVKPSYHLEELDKESLSVFHEDGSYIVYSKNDYVMKNYLYLTDLTNTDIIEAYKDLLGITTTHSQLISLIESGIGQFESNDMLDIIEVLEPDVHLEIYSEELEIDDTGVIQLYYRIKVSEDL